MTDAAITFQISYTYVTPNGAVLRTWAAADGVTPGDAIDAHLETRGGSKGILSIDAAANGSGRGSETRDLGTKTYVDMVGWIVVPTA